MTDQVHFECDPVSGTRKYSQLLRTSDKTCLFLTDLVFKGDFSQTQSQTLTVRNKSQHNVILFKFKMKTTCLKRYETMVDT